MQDLFYQGGTLFMGTLSFVFLIILSLSVFIGRKILAGEKVDREKVGLIKSVGIFAMVVGILGQLIGLFEAFKAIEQMGAVSPSMLAGGLKVSMITTFYGIIIFIISYVLWFFLNWRNLQSNS